MVRLGGGGAGRRGVTGSDRAQVVVAGTEQHALPLRTLEHAVIVRNQILRWFRRAAQEPDAARRRRARTFTIVGGGPTGVEFAGALAELIRGSFRKDYASLDFREVRGSCWRRWAPCCRGSPNACVLPPPLDCAGWGRGAFTGGRTAGRLRCGPPARRYNRAHRHRRMNGRRARELRGAGLGTVGIAQRPG